MADQFDKYAAQEDEWDKYAETAAPAPSPMPYKSEQIFNNQIGWIDQTEPNLKAAAEAGVDVQKKAPKGVRTGYEGFAVSEDQWRDFIDKEIKTALGPTAEVRRGPQSGEYEYFDPMANRWTVLRHSSIGQAAISKSADALSLAGSLAGMVGGPAGSVAKEVASGAMKTAVGSGAADFARTQIGNWLGVNDPTTSSTEEQFASAGKSAAIEGGLDLAGGTAYNIARYARASVKGKAIFTPEEAESLLNGLGKYRGLADEINRKSDVEFTPFLHQLVDPNNPAAQIAERWYSKLSESSNPDIRMAVAQARSNQYGALRSYFAKANQPFDIGIPPTAEGRQQAGQPLAEGIQGQIQQGTAEAQAAAQAQEAQARQAVQGLPQGVKQANVDAAQAVRDQLFAQSQASSAQVRESYKEFSNLISFDAATGKSPYYVEIKDPELITYIDKFGRNTITGSMKGGGAEKAASDLGITMVRKGQSMKVDLATLDATAKRLDQLYREKTEAGADVAYSDRDLLAAHNKVLDTISDYLKSGSMNGDLPAETYQKWVQSRALAKQDAETFKNGFLANFLAKDKTGNWVLNDQDALKTMIAGRDLQALAQMKDMIQHDPVAMAETKKLLFALYEKRATKNGLPSAKLHDEFMKPDNFGGVMEIFFKNDEFKKLDSYKDMADSFMASLANAKQVEKVLRQEFGGKISRWSPEQLVRSVLSKSMDTAQTAKMMRIARMKMPGGTAEALQNGVKNEIQMKLFPQGVDGAMDMAALSNMLRDHAGNLTQVMGPEYVASLRRLEETVPMLQRNPSTIGDPPVQTRLQMALRGFIRPMSREGNFMSFLRQNRGENLPFAIWEALTNVDELKRLANATRLAVIGSRVAGSTTAAGGQQVRDEDYVK
jgi:hypothetical protein